MLAPVRLNPVESPFERPHHAIFAAGVKAALPGVKHACDHTIYTSRRPMVFLLRLLINAVALWIAIQLVDGIEHTGSLWSLLFVALVFGALNASIRPVLQLLSLPMIILT